MKTSKRRRELADERLFRDIMTAIEACGARESASYSDGTQSAACVKWYVKERDRITFVVISALKRNWTVTERARGQTTL